MQLGRTLMEKKRRCFENLQVDHFYKFICAKLIPPCLTHWNIRDFCLFFCCVGGNQVMVRLVLIISHISSMLRKKGYIELIELLTIFPDSRLCGNNIENIEDLSI